MDAASPPISIGWWNSKFYTLFWHSHYCSTEIRTKYFAHIVFICNYICTSCT
jgi:hypothetical protein